MLQGCERLPFSEPFYKRMTMFLGYPENFLDQEHMGLHYHYQKWLSLTKRQYFLAKIANVGIGSLIRQYMPHMQVTWQGFFFWHSLIFDMPRQMWVLLSDHSFRARPMSPPLRPSRWWTVMYQSQSQEIQLPAPLLHFDIDEDVEMHMQNILYFHMSAVFDGCGQLFTNFPILLLLTLTVSGCVPR